MDAYLELTPRLAELSQLGSVMGILNWDQEVVMPKGAVSARGGQMATLTSLYHQRATDPRLGALLAECQSQEKNLDAWQKANVREAKRTYDRLVKIPADLEIALAELEVRGHEVWVQARLGANFKKFQPILDEYLSLLKQRAQAIDAHQHPYDVLIEDYEPGMNIKKIEALFLPLKDFLIPFLNQLLSRKNSKLTKVPGGPVAQSVQKELGLLILQQMGFDFERGRLDTSVHPFCGGAGPSDVRITTRYQDDHFVSALMGVIHEGGHALYEQGRNEKFYGQPVSEAVSMGLHESQSLLWEKQVGQGVNFWEFLSPKLKTLIPHALKGAEVKDLYHFVNQVKPSLIRVDADEVTYPFHIMIRFEIERDLLGGKILVKELSEIFNQKMQNYLGITPPNDREGVLQDVHWSGGTFGYFPSYTLGAMYAAQFFATAKKQIPNLLTEISKGNLKILRQWLKEKIHQQGSLYLADELCIQVTGEALNSKYFMNYLSEKYS
ncbi:MAG: carboxypeptidase M32 [Deltaproteobacteria bacterium]|nr:carboxypeptidase M32 [Deltaproteobacteria bacterium]